MLNFYPANKMENLVLLFDKILTTPKNAVLNPDIVLVQSKGMQHWLNMEIAQFSGISMNMQYMMPGQYFWQQLRSILGSSKVPEHSVFNRDVLCWRIYHLLANDTFCKSSLASEANQYWQVDNNDNKRFQLACVVADLFDQYLIYRSDWLAEWQSSEAPHWQALLWQLLVKDQPLHLASLIAEADNTLKQQANLLPERLFIFGINSLPPLLLNFLTIIANYTQVHLFHLNPCEQYWGDLQTEKQLGRQIQRWIDSQNSLLDIGNPLLANLGQQGREFLALLPNYCLNEIPVFEAPSALDNNSAENPTVLQQIQSDILQLNDARLAPKIAQDNSITFVSSHSRLREIQGLHDWLLHQFNDDEQLTPKDILVMCPQIEDYAPYIDAVFSRGWEMADEKAPPLPCSIADRKLRNSAPLVDTFEQLLQLPDSRFEVSAILNYLRLPAIQQKFLINDDEINQISVWLNQAAVHWGLNKSHKEARLNCGNLSNQFTWQQGLNRLMLGFAYSDQLSIVDEQQLLPSVEGDDAILLGRLMLLIEQLQHHSAQLTIKRTPSQWHSYLHDLRAALFEPTPQEQLGWDIISQAIDDLHQYCHQAEFAEPIPLIVVKQFLSQHFSQPDPVQQFLTGQVTFCSMIPMRSLPFKIIAIVGLNDGEFPRQRHNIGFDLISQNPPRIGDRSRRGDDRYLFLEALISCRQKLYLSYQGKDIKNNSQREPSIVIKELMDYLSVGYGWQCQAPSHCAIQLPMQVFSLANYLGEFPSFNQHWLTLAQQKNLEAEENLLPLTAQSTLDSHLTLNELIRFFIAPIKTFANERLGLRFTDEIEQLDDSEPFNVDQLDKYLIQERFVNSFISKECDDNQIFAHALLSGKLPDNTQSQTMLEQWHDASQQFAEHLLAAGINTLVYLPVSLNINEIELSAELPLCHNQQVFFRFTSVKAKDHISLWLHHLMANMMQDEYPQGIQTIGYYFNEHKQEVTTLVFEPIDNAKLHLSNVVKVWQKGLNQPIYCAAELAHTIFTNVDKSGQLKPFNQHHFNHYWSNDYSFNPPNADPYHHYFYQSAPLISDLISDLTTAFLPLYQHLNQQLTDDAVNSAFGVNQ